MSRNNGFGQRGVRTETTGGPSAATPTEGAQRSPLKLALAIVCGVLGFVGGGWLGREAVSQIFTYRASAAMDRSMADLERQARAKYPRLHAVEATALHAREAVPEFVNNSKSDRERAMKAAATFFGFYHVNTRSRVEHCAKLGVDLGPFAQLIARNHSREYSRALAVATDAGMTEERLWSMICSKLASMVKADMDEVGRRTRTTPQGACMAVADRADEFADKLDFATLQPQVQRILMGS